MAWVLVWLSLFLSACSQASLPLETLSLPPGVSVEVFAQVPGARSLALGERGTVFVGTRGDKVYAIEDGKVRVVAGGLDMPNGVAFKDGDLYVAEVSRVLRFPDIEIHPRVHPQVVIDGLPTARHHGWRYIRFGPDGWLYIGIGAPCNVCEVEDPLGSIARFRPDGTGFEIYARGVRNSVGFDWHPKTSILWFTDNGRDWLGDDVPPDELNRAPHPGLLFGFPYCHGGEVPDPDFTGPPCSAFVPPALKLPAHVAPLGMRFYTGAMLPELEGHILIAEHGSWNRSVPIGYRITRVKVERGKALSYEVFIEGWLQGEKAWGRPVDVLVRRDGSLLVSDDHAGVIYRFWKPAGPR